MPELIIKGPIVIAVFVLIILLLLLIQYKQILKQKIITFASILLGLRFAIILILIYLVFNPLFVFNKIYRTPSKVGLFIDSSKSIGLHQSNSEIKYSNEIKLLEKQLLRNNNDVYIKTFSSSLDKINNIEDIDYNGNFTSYDFLLDKFAMKELDNIILVTDGISTYGNKLETMKLNVPLYTIGIGNKNINIDLSLNNIEYDKKVGYDDSLQINYFIKSNLYKNYFSNIIVENSIGNRIFSSRINFDNGNKFIEGIIKLPVALFSNINKISIEPLDEEVNKQNNAILFDLDIIDIPKKILLISGSISTNTFLVKKVIKNKNFYSLDHFYKITNNKWNKTINNIDFENYDLVIFDDFINLNELNVKKNNSILFFEGPSSISYNKNRIKNLFNVTIKNDMELIDEKLVNNVSYKFDFSKLPPFKKNYLYKVNKNNSLLKYSDDSDAIVKNDNMIGVFIPEIGNVYRKVKNIEEKVILEELMFSLLEILLEKDTALIKFNLVDNKYSIGQPIKIKLNYSSLVDPLFINNYVEIVATKDSIRQILNIDYDYKYDSYYCIFEPKSSGKWEINGLINYNNLIQLEPVNFIVQDYDIESIIVTQNILGLQSLSEKTGGKYIFIEDLSNSYDDLFFDANIKNEDIDISAINNLKFLWILILFFSIEWYYRKRKGLL